MLRFNITIIEILTFYYTLSNNYYIFIYLFLLSLNASRASFIDILLLPQLGALKGQCWKHPLQFTVFKYSSNFKSSIFIFLPYKKYNTKQVLFTSHYYLYNNVIFLKFIIFWTILTFFSFFVKNLISYFY